jgi:acyl-CoA reductase-like NAD-dependent aldehyde dehydrogenase
MIQTELFIDGSFVPAADGRTFPTISPRDGSTVAHVARGGARDVDRAVSAARRAFDDGAWARAAPADRGRALIRLAQLMTEHLDDLALIESQVVDRTVRDELLERLHGAAASFIPGDPLKADTVLGALISDEHLDGVIAHVERAVAQGATVLAGGSRVQPVAGGAYMEPTIIDAEDPGMQIVTEEVFGPVLTIQTATDTEHALALANATRYGLAAALWTADVRTAGQVARRLRAGTVWVNTFDAASMATPFGGVKDSGHGRDRSLHALDAYTQPKTTWISLS